MNHSHPLARGGVRRREDQRVDHWFMSELLPAGRSGPGAPSGGVVGRRWSSCQKIFPGNRGSLMAAEDSRDEGELIGVRYDH